MPPGGILSIGGDWGGNGFGSGFGPSSGGGFGFLEKGGFGSIFGASSGSACGTVTGFVTDWLLLVFRWSDSSFLSKSLTKIIPKTSKKIRIVAPSTPTDMMSTIDHILYCNWIFGIN